MEQQLEWVPPPGSPGYHGAMAHLYRAEINRMTIWRERLDITSNWAVLLTIGLTTFTLGSDDVPHYVLLLGLGLIGISILLEGRRYRHLHHSKYRLALIEAGYFAPMLGGAAGAADVPSTEAWRNTLRADLEHPQLLISWFTAIRARLRRNYILLLYVVTAVWITKIFIHPQSPASAAEFYGRLAVGDLIPAWFVAVSAPVFVIGATILALSCPSAEELEDWSGGRSRHDAPAAL